MPAVPQTPNFKLYKPEFDKRAWHTYVNQNFEIIDAALATYLDVLNIYGVWTNSTSFSVGQRAVDPVVGQMFQCLTAHTSAASPTTFTQDRTANPTYWSSLSVTARGLGAWTPGTPYQPNDFVVDGLIYAVCIASHTSGATFAGDIVYWDYLLDASTLPTVPSISGKSLQVLRANVGETGTEWATSASIISWLGLGSAAFVASSTFANASHVHNVADLSDSSADAKLFLQAANDAAMRTELGLGALATAASVGTAQIDNDAVTYAKIQNTGAASVVLGRGSAAGAGDVQELTAGQGISFSGTTVRALGTVAQIVQNELLTVQILNGTIANDNSAPQDTEGEQFLSQAITPQNASSTLVIEVVAQVGASATNNCVIGLFVAGTTDALRTAAARLDLSWQASLSIKYIVSAGSTSSRTYNVRGGAASGDMNVNGVGAGVQKYGGTMATSITITEYLPVS